MHANQSLSQKSEPRPLMGATLDAIDSLSSVAEEFILEDKKKHLGFDEYSREVFEEYEVDTKADLLQLFHEQGRPLSVLEKVLSTDERFFTSAQLARFLNGNHRYLGDSGKDKKEYSSYYINKAIEALDIDTDKFKSYDYAYAVTLSEAYKIKDYIDEINGKKAAQDRKFKKKKLPGIVVGIANQKGGAGKTTTVHSLSTGIAILEPDAKVLIIDSDHQATLTDYYSVDIIELLGIDKSEDSYLRDQDVSLGDILSASNPQEARELVDMAIRKTPIPNLDLLPARRRDNSVNNEIYKKRKSDQTGEMAVDDKTLLVRMEKALSHLVYEYDYIFIDMSPQVTNLLSYNVLSFCHQVIVPFACTRNDVQATAEWLSELSSQIHLLNEYGAYGFIDEPYLLRTNYEKQKSQTEIETSLAKCFGRYLLSNKHMHSEAISYANVCRKSIFEVSEAEVEGKKAYKRAVENTLDVVEEIKSKLDVSRKLLLNCVEEELQVEEV